LCALAAQDALDKPAAGWDGAGGGFPTPFHVFLYHYRSIEGPALGKWEHYLEPYHKHFDRYRGKQVTLIEMGVQSGGSALMWRWYFGPGLHYIGIDINPECEQFDTLPWIDIEIGDAEDPLFWAEFKAKYPTADIFVDDGGHTQKQMIAAFENYYSNVAAGGIFLTEDTHTCYFEDYGGNSNPDIQQPIQAQSYIEYSHHLIDWLHGYRLSDEYVLTHRQNLAAFVGTTSSIHYYESIVLIEKLSAYYKRPVPIEAGTRNIPYTSNTPFFGTVYNFSQIQGLSTLGIVM
jgi:hypothetical protein